MNYNIDSEIILQRKINPIIYIYTLVIIIIVLSFILLMLFCKYQTYLNIKGIIVNEDNHYYIIAYLPLDDIKIITDNSTLYIDKEKYDYSIIELSEEYIADNITTYQRIKIDTNIPSKYQINNLTINLKIPKENKKIINYILYT